MLVRRARRDEAGDIAELWSELVAYHNELDSALPRPTIDGPDRYAYLIMDRIGRDDSAVLVAIDDGGVVVGYALGIVIDTVPETFLSRRAGLLADIYVQPHARRNGYGQALVRAMMDWCEALELPALEWEVAAANETGRAFWRAVHGRELMIRMRMNLEGGQHDNGN